MDGELENLGAALCRAIAANRHEESRELAEQCVALHTAQTHHAVMSILERARRLAIAQRSFAAIRLADLQSADRYAPDVDGQPRLIGQG